MTIYYNHLGSNGRLGNQMFQYASFRGIAANRGFAWKIPPEDTETTSNYGLFECFKMIHVKEENLGLSPSQYPNIGENDHSFDEALFNGCPDNSNIHAYLQTEKYFKNIENEIREDFQFKDDIYESCKEVIDEVGDAIFIHVRRGDYLGSPNHHPTLTPEYYENALEKFDSEIPVFVFSDDLVWCKEQDFLKSDRFLLSENHIKYPNKVLLGDGTVDHSLIPYWDLCLMTLCKGAIIANSSLSWWGAWLQNGAGQVIAPNPQNWFGTALSHLDKTDIVPETWTIQEWSNQ